MATRYWVGGAGNWSSTTKWSTTSGGTSGASVPTSADDVIFDANSGGKFTATVDTAQTCASLSITPSSGAGVLQLAITSSLTVTGAFSTSGTAGNNRIWIRGTTYGIRTNLVCNGSVSISDCDFRDIIVNGTAAPISGTRIGNRGACVGITFSTPKTVYWNQPAGGQWSNNAWATTSGGSVSTDNFPLPQDTAVIGNTGLNTSATLSIDLAIPALGTIDMSGRTNAMTLNPSNAFTVYGNWINGSNITFIGNSIGTFAGGNTQTITCNGLTLSFPITVDSYGGTVELADALNINSGLTVTNGTFDTKGFAVTLSGGSFSSNNSNVRAIKLNSSTVTTSFSFIFTTTTNLTFDAGSSQINMSSNSGNLSASGLQFNNVTFATSSGSARNIGGSNTFNNLTLTVSGAGLSELSLSGNQTLTGTLTVAGSSATSRCFLRSDTLGTTRTITANAISADDCDFRDITIAGSAAGASPTRAGNCGGNSGINFPAPKTVYWNLGGTPNWLSTGWAATSGGTPAVNNFPLAQDTAVFDNAGAAGTVTISAVNICTIDASARTNAMTLNWASATPCYGNFTLGSGVTVSGTSTATFSGRGTQTFTSAGKTITFPITVDSFSGTFQLGDALTLGSTRTLTLTSGTFDAVTYNVTIGAFNCSSATNTTLKMGSGLWTLSGTGTVWLSSTFPAVFYKGTADILLSDTSTTARTFAGAGLSYNKLTIGGTTGISTTTIGGNNQFTELASTKTVAHTIDFGSTTQTFGKWTVTGSAGNVVTLSGTGTSHVLAGSCTSGIDYLAMGSIGFAATSPAEFYAGANSTGTASAPVYRTAKPADSTRYWVGGTGNWSDTARWSTSSGGASGASVPRSHDDVVFDTLSNLTAYTATINAVTGGIRCKSLTIAPPATGNITLAGSTAIDGIHGNVTLPATGLTRTYTGQITLSGSTTGRTINTNGVTLGSTIVVNGIGCEWGLGSAINSNRFSIINGSFVTNNYNLTTQAFDSAYTTPRSISLGSSTLSISGFITPFNLGTTASQRAELTFNAGTSLLSIGVGGFTFSGNNQTFNDISFTSSSPAVNVINGANTFNNMSFTGTTSAGLREFGFSANQTINGTLTLSAGTNATCRTFVRSDTIGTTRTLTCNAVASLTDIDFRDITIAGSAAPISGTRLGDCKGNSGITFDAPKTVYRVGSNTGWTGSNSWALTSNGTGNDNNFPLAQDTAIFDNIASAATVTINSGHNVGTIDMSSRTNAMNFGTSLVSSTIYGNIVTGSGITYTGTQPFIFSGRGSQTITSAGKTFTQGFTINSPSGSVTLQDALICSSNALTALTINIGTFSASSYNVTISAANGGVTSTTATTRTIDIGSGVWVIAGSGTSWAANPSTNLTVTGTGIISLTSSSAKTFAGGDISYSGITLNQGGTGTLTITGNNTFANITNTATGATTIALGSTTQRVANFTATGTAGNVLTITGNTSNLIYTGSGAITGLDYLNVQGRVYGSAGQITDVWYAGANSVNSGSLGWVFAAGVTPPPSANSNFFLMFG